MTEPRFVIRGKDALAPEVINAYVRACEARELTDQANQVRLALQEILEWQERNPHLVKPPDHAHVPADAQDDLRDWAARQEQEAVQIQAIRERALALAMQRGSGGPFKSGPQGPLDKIIQEAVMIEAYLRGEVRP